MKFKISLVLISLFLSLKSEASPSFLGVVDVIRGLDLDSLSTVSGGWVDDLDQQKYQQVTKMYGVTTINLASLPQSSPMLDSGKRAWSSWWFQKNQREFTSNSQNSILAKYDRAFETTGSSRSAFSYELNLEKNQYAPWEGLCDAWAMASLFYAEPKHSVTTRGVTFSLSEVKGLILKTFEAVPDSDFQNFGEKFIGNQDGWVYPDLFPDQFHRLVEVVLGQKKQAFLMDRDPGPEVWNIPIYKANFRVDANPENRNSVFVKLWLFSAAPLSYDDREKTTTQEVVFEYAYELTGDLSDDGNQLKVTGGRWIQSGFTDSRANHPDYVLVPRAEGLNRGSFNPFISKSAVDQIAKGSL